MKQIRTHLVHSLPFFFLLAVLLLYAATRAYAICNVLVQALLFALVVIIPAWRTGRMGYVDLGWPIGLFLIGVQLPLFSAVDGPRSWIVASLYLFAGGRMGLMALIGWRGGWLDKELPRYQYQRLRWQRRGWREMPALLYEVAIQGLANMSVLAVPAILQAANPSPQLSPLEVAGYALWLAAFVFEFTADAQKTRFNQRMQREKRKGEHCAEGLWRYSRHPNYFGEWMVWNSLALTTLPTLLQLELVYGVLFGAALLFLSYAMYIVLTDYSGAVPAEYYSVKKRPGYAEYQRRTNMFFPGPTISPRRSFDRSDEHKNVIQRDEVKLGAVAKDRILGNP